MTTPFTTRAILKIKRTVRELTPAEREFGRVWPLISSIDGLLLAGQENWLFKRARSLPDGANVVEIGSFMGRSTCSLAFGCRGTNKHVFAVDTFDGNTWDFHDRDFLPQFQQNVERCGLSRYVHPVIGLSAEVAKSWNKPIHLLFIDGSHRYEDVLADFEGFFSHVVTGGTVAFHDVDVSWPGVLKAWNENIRSQLVDTGYCSSIGYGRKPRGR